MRSLLRRATQSLTGSHLRARSSSSRGEASSRSPDRSTRSSRSPTPHSNGPPSNGDSDGEVVRRERGPSLDDETQAEILEAFNRFDENGDGVISREELASVLRQLDSTFWTEEHITMLMRAADRNGDGIIQYIEFVSWVTGRSAAQLLAVELDSPSSPRLDFRTALDTMDGVNEFQISEAFFRFDKNNDGVISRAELAEVMQNLDPTAWDDGKVNMLLQVADENRDNRIQYKEFCAWILGQPPARHLAEALIGESSQDVPTHEKIAEAFQRFDEDGDGIITRAELARILRRLDPFKWTDKKINALLQAADTNGDGTIQYEEFVAWVMQGPDAFSKLDVPIPPEPIRTPQTGPIQVSIVKMNGQTLKAVTLSRDDPVRVLRSAASEALGGKPCKLVAGENYLGNRQTLADAGLHNGASVTAVVSTGILQLAFTNQGGYAALKADGSVVTWGSTHAGGDSSYVAEKLRDNVDHVYATWLAFAALKGDGSVVCWGSVAHGGNSSVVAHQLNEGVVQIVSTREAFAAVKSNGSVVLWGNSSGGPPAPLFCGDIQSIYSNRLAFAAVKSDGSVVTWGSAACGGEVGTLVKEQLTSGVSQIFSTSSAFLALRTDGSVLVWGDPSMGGDITSVSHKLRNNVKKIHANNCAFAAVKTTGTVVTWGHPEAGGCSDEVASQLESGVEQVFSTDTAFAALKADGAVVCWGLEGGINSTQGMANQLSSGVVAVSCTSSAFAALKSDGTVVAWGQETAGGCCAHVAHRLGNEVQRIFATEGAFAALQIGGSIVAWGAEDYGGDSSAVEEQLKEGVSHVFATRQSFAAQKIDNSVVAWGAGIEPVALAKLQPFYAPVAAG